MLGFTSASCDALFLFFRFQRFPISQDFGGSFGGYIPEHMGMTVYQLVRKAVENIVNREAFVFGCHLRIKEHLQKQVAELARKFVPVTVVDGFEHFISLLEGKRLDRIKGLLA